MTFERIALVLTCLTAALGILVAFTDLSYIFVAIAGVFAGLWWAFGRKVLPASSQSRSKVDA